MQKRQRVAAFVCVSHVSRYARDEIKVLQPILIADAQAPRPKIMTNRRSTVGLKSPDKASAKSAAACSCCSERMSHGSRVASVIAQRQSSSGSICVIRSSGTSRTPQWVSSECWLVSNMPSARAESCTQIRLLGPLQSHLPSLLWGVSAGSLKHLKSSPLTLVAILGAIRNSPCF